MWIVSASAPQLPLQIEDAMRSEEAEGPEADGGIKIRVNQVEWLLGGLALGEQIFVLHYFAFIEVLFSFFVENVNITPGIK